MKITFKKNELMAAMRKVSLGINPKNPVTAAQCVLFEISNGTVEAKGTGAFVTVQTVVQDAEPDEDGKFLVNAKILSDILKGSADDEVTIERDGADLVRIKVGKAKFNLATPKLEDYPDVTLSSNGIKVQLDARILNQIVEHVAFAATKRPIKPILTGVHLRSTDNGMVAEATDSYRLAQEIYPVMTPEDFSVTVPETTLSALPSIFSDDDGMIEMYVSDQAVIFAGSKAAVKTNVLDGDYPEVDRFFNISLNYEWKVDRLDMIGAITRTKFIKNDGMLIIKLDVGNDHSYLENRNQDLGDSVEEVNLEILKGDPLKISYCGDFLLDALKAFDGEECLSIKSGGANRPAVIEKLGDSVGMRQLVLPVRTYN